MILSRRSVLFGLIAAPIVVRAGLIMPVKPLVEFEGALGTFEGIRFVGEARVIQEGDPVVYRLREALRPGLRDIFYSDWSGVFGDPFEA